MKTFIHWLAIGGLTLWIGATTTMAQENPSAGIVAVLDVAKVFQKNLEFDQKMEGIRKEAEALKNSVQQSQEQIVQDAQVLKTLDPTSPQFRQKELELEQRQAELRATARQREADLLVREAKAYFETYQKMQSAVTAFALENRISMVLRFDSSPIDPENRPDVIKGVNRAVVYHQNLDMTRFIIEAMGPQVAETPTNIK